MLPANHVRRSNAKEAAEKKPENLKYFSFTSKEFITACALHDLTFEKVCTCATTLRSNVMIYTTIDLPSEVKAYLSKQSESQRVLRY